MFRSAIWIVLVVTPAWAAPKLKPKTPDVPPLVGTKWVGLTYEKLPLVIEFKADGVVTIMDNTTLVQNTGWSQYGDKIYFHMNMKYCEFNGRVKGDKVDGESHNVTGLRWETSLTREREK